MINKKICIIKKNDQTSQVFHAKQSSSDVWRSEYHYCQTGELWCLKYFYKRNVEFL